MLEASSPTHGHMHPVHGAGADPGQRHARSAADDPGVGQVGLRLHGLVCTACTARPHRGPASIHPQPPTFTPSSIISAPDSIES